MNGRMITAALALAGLAGAQSVEDTVARAQAKAASQKATTAANLADAATKADVEQNEKIQAVEGKVDGLNEDYLETKATVAALKKFKVGGFVQFQYAYAADTNLSGGFSQKQGAWSLRRARLKFTYDAGNGAQLVWQPNFIESKFETKDAYLQYTEQWFKAVSLRAGIQDIPFGYEIGNSSSGMELIERSQYENNSVFNGEKTLGILAGFNSPTFPYVNAKVGWFNGQTQQAVTGDWTATQDPKNIVGRVGVSFAFNDAGLSIDAGQSYFYDSKILTVDSLKENIKGRGYDTFGFVKGRLRNDVNTVISGEDLQLTYEIPMVGGFKLMTEYYQGKIIGVSGSNKLYTGAAATTADVRNTMGFYVAGVLNPINILPQIQLVYRFDYYDPNTDVSGSDIDALRGFSKTDIAYTVNTIGLNWFVNGNFKVSLFYDIKANETTGAPSLDGYAGDAKRTQAAGALKTGLYTAANNFSKNIDDNVLTLRGQVAF
jgi:phosphate-selective porin